MLKEYLQFEGTWRSYQARVLEHSKEYLQDGKIHIVAAPGSGKTTLGIELIRRLDAPVLILAPSITIREQWKNRIVEAFLKNKERADQLISQDIKQPAVITIATYQALHSAMTRTSGIIDQEEGSEGEFVDFTSFDVLKKMHLMGVQVLCLDECHHLRSEWWKALETFKKRMQKLKTISLTATPPYDSTPQQWKRYIDMCGEIDEEISVPELVKEGSLCPHQDFIYFNYPTKDEMNAVNDFNQKTGAIVAFFLQNPEFENVIKTHRALKDETEPAYMLENPSYLSSLLIYLDTKGIECPKRVRNLIGSKSLPIINAKWMEILLQNVLYDSIHDVECPDIYREKWIQILKQNGCIEKRKVILSVNPSIEKMLISSKAKLNSILDIVDSEYQSMKNELRMLVLTDYIRKEQEKILGSETVVSNLGVLPFFEAIRRHLIDMNTNAYLGVLCGSLIIIPSYSMNKLKEITKENASKLSFSKIGKINENEYIQVNVSGSSHFVTNAITELFNQGYIQIMIGTKSLLGEGWDSPCINSLILASFVGSFMLSNQMRGRAIRVMKQNPNKTSNIWHLVCVKPPSLIQKELKEQENVSASEDWELLERRMEHFLGLHYEENIIEDGIGRFSCIRTPFTKQNIEKTNKDMLALSRNREELAIRWKEALAIQSNMEISKESEVDEKLITMAAFYDSLGAMMVSFLASGVFFAAYMMVPTGFISAIIGLLTMFSTAIGVFFVPRILKMRSPYNRLKLFGKALVDAMKEIGYLQEETYDIQVTEVDGTFYTISLKGGSEREKDLFAKSIKEFYAPIDNQRYLLVKQGKLKGKHGYYCVPDIFSTHKDKATCFYRHIEKSVGKYDLVYTRSGVGRQILLNARAHSYANVEQRIVERKKNKSKFE